MAADVGYRQADDDLDGTAVFHQAKGTGIGKLARSRDFIRIVDRDPQASCTVGDFLDVVGTAEAVEEDLRFQGISTAGNTLLFHFFLGLVFGLGKQFIVFTVISASRRLKVEVQDEEAEHDEINEGKAEPMAICMIYVQAWKRNKGIQFWTMLSMRPPPKLPDKPIR